VSLYVPIGFSLVPAIAFTALGFWGYFIGGCSGLSGCYVNPLADVYGDRKFIQFLLLSWGFGLLMVFSMAYQNLKTEVHE
jgi:hypothetical protein